MFAHSKSVWSEKSRRGVFVKTILKKVLPERLKRFIKFQAARLSSGSRSAIRLVEAAN